MLLDRMAQMMTVKLVIWGGGRAQKMYPAASSTVLAHVFLGCRASGGAVVTQFGH